MVPPDEFLAAAEEAGLTRRLTARVLAMALGQLSEWCREDRAVPVAVNLAAADLLDPCLPDQIVAALRQEGLPPHLLRLEVTEGSLMTEQHRTAEALLRLRRIGVGLSLDDFGTGYSSLAYLLHLPVDELKLDKSFLRGIHDNPRSAALVQQTITLGHALGLTVVAEGIEDAEMFATLRAMSCDIAQGRYISWPLPADMLAVWLAAACGRSVCDCARVRYRNEAHVTPRAGLCLVAVAAALVIAAPRSTRMAQRFGPKLVCGIGLAIAATCFGLYFFVQPDTPPWVVEVLLFVHGLGMGNVLPPATNAIMGRDPAREGRCRRRRERRVPAGRRGAGGGYSRLDPVGGVPAPARRGG
jgi:EAL domain-containing protein (putative c-di-GMP-specific phosphodiesterase class I)